MSTVTDRPGRPAARRAAARPTGSADRGAAVTADERVDWAYAVVRARRLRAEHVEIMLLNIASNLSAPDLHDYRVVGGSCLRALYGELRQLGLLDLYREMVEAWLTATVEPHQDAAAAPAAA